MRHRKGIVTQGKLLELSVVGQLELSILGLAGAVTHGISHTCQTVLWLGLSDQCCWLLRLPGTVKPSSCF